jgi:prepilin-type N-terminal cleavage/methylation domain-containing protein
MPDMRKKNRAFTLVELLIVISMMSVVSLAIYSALNNGLKIWQRVNRQVPQEDANIFLNKVSSDLRNAVKLKKINFSGNEERLEFPSLVYSSRWQNKSVGKIYYAYDSKSGIITQEQRDYSMLFSDEPGVKRQLLSGLSALKFQFYYYDKDNKEYLWLDEWSKEGLPLAVKVEIEISGQGKTNTFVKTVDIPVGG